jgi:hypothetical protein
VETAVTVAAIVIGAVLVGLMSWLERRPRTGLSPRLFPTTPLMFAGALIAILALVHLLTILGVSMPRR